MDPKGIESRYQSPSIDRIYSNFFQSRNTNVGNSDRSQSSAAYSRTFNGDNSTTKRALDLSSDTKSSSFLSRVGTSISDSFLGIGHYSSRFGESFLDQVTSPKILKIQQGLGRSLGGVASLAGVGYRLYQAGSEDFKERELRFTETRKELVLSLGSMAGAVGVGEAGYLATAAVASLGAPVTVVAGLGVATALGAGYTAYKIREGLDAYYGRGHSNSNE